VTTPLPCEAKDCHRRSHRRVCERTGPGTTRDSAPPRARLTTCLPPWNRSNPTPRANSRTTSAGRAGPPTNFLRRSKNAMTCEKSPNPDGRSGFDRRTRHEHRLKREQRPDEHRDLPHTERRRIADGTRRNAGSTTQGGTRDETLANLDDVI